MHQAIIRKNQLSNLDELLDFYQQNKNEKNNTETETEENKKQISLNQILYGSPATGKTYNTIDRALEILGIDCEGKTQEERKRLFEDYRQKEQIEFVTFHQSYGYEEFVEGIKPKTDEKSNVVYEVANGIFKEMCLKAQICNYTYEIDNIISDFIEKSITNKMLFQMQKGENFRIKTFENGKIMCEKISPKEGEKKTKQLKSFNTSSNPF